MGNGLSPVARGDVRFKVWWSSFRERMGNRVDRDRVLAGWFGLPIYLLATVIMTTVLVAGWAVLAMMGVTEYPVTVVMGENGQVSTQYSDPNLVIGLSVVFTALAYGFMLITPIVRRVIRVNGGLGLTMRGFADRMRVRANASNRMLVAWLKAIGIGIAAGVVCLGVNQLIANIVNLIPSAGVGGSVSNDTSAILIGMIRGLFNGGENVNIPMSVFVLIFTVALGPFLEECLFRGFIGRSFIMSSIGQGQPLNAEGEPQDSGIKPSRLRTFLVCLLSGMIFGCAHAQFTGRWAVDLLTVTSTGLVGVILTWLACVKYRNIWVSFIGHTVYNTSTLVLAFLVL